MSLLHILHLLPPPSLSLLLPFHRTVLAYSLHTLHTWTYWGLSPFGLLLTWVSVSGASRWRILLRWQPIWACERKKKRWNMNRTTEESLRAGTDNLQKRAGRDRNQDRRALIKGFLPSYKRSHIDWVSVFPIRLNRKTEERLFDAE